MHNSEELADREAAAAQSGGHIDGPETTVADRHLRARRIRAVALGTAAVLAAVLATVQLTGSRPASASSPGFLSANGSPVAGGGFGPGFQIPYPSQGVSGQTSTAKGAPSDISGIAAKVAPTLVDIDTNLGYQSAAAAGTGVVLTSTARS